MKKQVLSAKWQTAWSTFKLDNTCTEDSCVYFKPHTYIHTSIQTRIVFDQWRNLKWSEKHFFIDIPSFQLKWNKGRILSHTVRFLLALSSWAVLCILHPPPPKTSLWHSFQLILPVLKMLLISDCIFPSCIIPIFMETENFRLLFIFHFPFRCVQFLSPSQYLFLCTLAIRI